ncbi:MAG TPA: hypothetical protein PLU07_07145 [Ferruginibacter sp.]|nr:hypothetical protein [Ferruginibacter sp.]
MKPFVLKTHHTILQALVQSIDSVLAMHKAEDDIDKLILATLYSLNQRFKVRLVRPKTKYSFTLEPNEAIALRLHYTEFIGTPTSYIGSFVLAVANQVDQFYSNSNFQYETSNSLLSNHSLDHVRHTGISR